MSAPTMNKKKKAGIREKVGTALSWLLSLGHDKPPHNIKRIDHEPPTLPQDTDKSASLVAHVRSPREDGNPLMETTSSVRERGGTDSSGSAERTTFQDPLDLLKQSTTNSTSSSAFDDSVMDNSGIFSFLNDVIAGKHTELLKEMCHSSSSTEKGKEESAEEAAPQRSLKNSEETQSGEVVVAEAAPLEPRQEKKGEGGGGGGGGGGKVMKKQKRLTVKALKAGGTSSAARLLKEYELIAYLGTGSFAEVTLARHKVTRKLYALKKISKRKVRKERCVKHTFTERQLLASLAHPFLVKLHQAFQSRTHLYLVLDFASGGDMYFFLKSKPWLREIQRKLQRTRKVSWHDDVSYFYLTGAQGESDIVSSHLRTSSKSFQSSDALSNTISSPRSLAPNESRTPIRLVAFYAIEIALVLQFLHDNGFVYRDLKPENVLITREGNVVLTDFGVAKYRGASNVKKQVDERSDSFAGTTQYMSPEMLLGEPHDSRIDWWSFGCILFEMATGRRPFEGESQYDVVKSIVERDVCVYPDDFLLTPLEIELRVLQLHRRYHRFLLRLMRQISQGIKNENESEEEATPRPSNACIETHSAFPTVMLPISKCTPVPETRPECGGDNSMPGPQSDVFNVSSNDIRKVKAPMTSEEHALYVEYVKEEMNEACEHLKGLILSLLNRRVDQRLCGKSVLEHPFFSCGYVCSQLYYNFYPRSEQINNNNNNNSFCTPTTGNSSIVMSSQCATSPSNELLHSSLPRGESALVSSGHCLGNNSVTDYSPRKQNENEMREEESGDNMSFGNVQRTLNVTRFLSLPPTQRPENWRELFLERKVPPLYVPRLLAPDDLRYFPSAVTAMGESVVTQQRVLHEHTQRKTVSSRPHDVNEAEKGVPLSRTMPRKENPLPEDTQTSEEDENIELMEPSSNIQRRDSWVPGEEKKRMDISFEGSSHLGDTTGSFQSRLRDFFPGSSPQSFETSLVQTSPMKLKPRGKLCTNEFCEDEETGTEHHDGSPQQLKLTRLDTSSSLCGTETTLTTSATTISKGILSTEKSHALNTITLSPERRERPGFVLNSEADLTNREEGSIPDVSLPTDTLLKSTLRSESMSSVHRDVSSFATSIVSLSDDDYDRLVKTEDDKLDKQVATLQGIAYDVDDYLPTASKCRNKLLRNKTGILTLESSVSTDSKVDMRQIGNQKSDPLAPLWTQETLAAGEAPSNDNRQFPTYIPIAIQASETSVPIFATTTTSTTIANAGYENRESGGDPNHRQTSIFSTLSPDLIASAASPRSPRGASPRSSTSLTPELHRLPMLFHSTEMPSLGDIVEDHPNSPTLGSSSFLGGGGGGGMQHYLGFTFDARGGNAFLLGNSSGGANNEKWGF